MHRRAGVLCLAAAFGLAILGSGPAPVEAATCGAGSSALLDGGFETPVVDPGTYAELVASLVPPWLTTDVSNEIEIWGLGFNGVPDAEGSQFAELNANSPGTLYQDVVTTPGEHMTWTLAHRGRLGDDTMKVLIGDAATADVTSDTGWNYFSTGLTDGTDAWGTHTADYVVPAGQVCTRFAFRAVSSTGGDPSIGNFLDAVGFSVSVPATPTPRPSRRPSPPVTATIGPDQSAGSGPSWLLLLSLGAFSLAVGSRQLGRRTPRKGSSRSG
jgi:hypothetical protein